MRPLRLELRGFASFREETVIEFEGVDYFALVGATGSGKSTVIDAICFALYGSVPRYENRSLVAPVITQGQIEAKVRLDFEIDSKAYTAVRVITRSSTGGKTKEARLECDGEVIAGTGDELTAAAESLIGLTFEHFIKCVVLPQGEFARFLHDKPSVRQDMLVRLLGLDIYEKMRQRAASDERDLKVRTAMLTQRLEEGFERATNESLKETKSYLTRVEKVRKQVDAAMPKLDVTAKQILEAEEDVERFAAWIEKLSTLEVPGSMSEFGDQLEHAKKGMEEAQAAVTSAEAASTGALVVLEALPDKGPLLVAAQAHIRRSEVVAQLEADRIVLATADESAIRAAEAVTNAEVAVDAAELAARQARDEHAALHLAGSLNAGEPCPVCLQVVEKLPKHPKAAAIATAEKSAEQTRKLLNQARADLERVAANRTALTAAVETLEQQVRALDGDIAKHLDANELGVSIAEIAEAESKLAAARTTESSARAELLQAQQKVMALREKEDVEWKRFEELRDPLGPLQPPPARRKDLITDYEALLTWGQTKIPKLTTESKAAELRLQKASKTRDTLLESVSEACADCGLSFEGSDELREVVLKAHLAAVAEVDAISKDIEASKRLRRELKTAEAERELSGSLARHLSANYFEQWLVGEALRRLVEGATLILKELSNGQYSLAVADKSGNFQVTDHHNANESRSAKTLSGGETFLASLSLALALSDQLMELAAQGSARLDAIFLDEGFGTLDPETLDTVAATVENLAAGGRMVGVVTHVRDLADRVPLQFQVTKDARTSKVTKVVA